MCGWNLFIVLLTNNLFSIHFEWPKEEVNISKSITYICKKKYKTLITLEKCNFINNLLEKF